VAIKLERMDLKSESEIKAMPHDELVGLTLKLVERMAYYQGLLFKAQKDKFGKSSERSPKADEAAPSGGEIDKGKDPPKPKNSRATTTKQLSTRYPNAPVQEKTIGFTEPPCCPECGKIMQNSGMTEDSEYLTTTPQEYIIVRQKREKHRCQKCHSSIATAPAPARIVEGGSYSDDMIIDATVAKFCNLIPMERYCQMAERGGLVGLPPHSLIAAQMKLSAFLTLVYQRIILQTLITKVLLADETPHKMLEGDAKTNWQLWGFSTEHSCFFECHSTRSGDISFAVLVISECEYLLSDVYSGYSKAIRMANVERNKKGLPPIIAAYCNAHARRKFKDRDSAEVSLDSEWMVEQYKLIYKLNKESKDLPPEQVLEKRAEMKPIFGAMKKEALEKIESYSKHSQMFAAYNYFLENYEGLTRFLDNHLIPIDNNQSERLLRSHVVGRKTWYGTHSRRAAESAAVHFTIVESCKMVGVNPREFYKDAVRRIHENEESITPFEYKKLKDADTC
jgi:transposase